MGRLRRGSEGIPLSSRGFPLRKAIERSALAAIHLNHCEIGCNGHSCRAADEMDLAADAQSGQGETIAAFQLTCSPVCKIDSSTSETRIVCNQIVCFPQQAAEQAGSMRH